MKKKQTKWEQNNDDETISDVKRKFSRQRQNFGKFRRVRHFSYFFFPSSYCYLDKNTRQIYDLTHWSIAHHCNITFFWSHFRWFCCKYDAVSQSNARCQLIYASNLFTRFFHTLLFLRFIINQLFDLIFVESLNSNGKLIVVFKHFFQFMDAKLRKCSIGVNVKIDLFIVFQLFCLYFFVNS